MSLAGAQEMYVPKVGSLTASSFSWLKPTGEADSEDYFRFSERNLSTWK